MAQRETRKAGILKTRYQDPKLQRSFDAIIERLEVLDGLRGDALDKAVTYRDLTASGFVVSTGGAGGSPSIDSTPGSTPGGGDGPTVGPAAAPTNLVATDIFLAILLTWDNASFNLQHNEVWRSTDAVLANAVLIGTTVAPQYIDYVGAEQTYYYWVRSVGTDGTFSAYSAMATGTTGVNPEGIVDRITNITAADLSEALAERIDLIDVDGVLDSLMNRVAAAQGDIAAAQSDITTLEASYTGMVDGTSIPAGVNALYTANAGLIAANTTSITTLTNTTIPGISGRLDDNEADIVANAQQLLELQASVGALDAEAGESWQFTTDLESFTANNATATWLSGGYLGFTPSGADPQLLSPVLAGVSGSINTQVVVRVRLTSGVVSAWEGNLYYKTTGGWHTAKTIADPSLALSTWQTLTWDMRAESSWFNGTITQIRLDLVSDAAGQFEVDWIQIARVSTSALSTAISAVDSRVTATNLVVSAQGTSIDALNAVVDVDGGAVANAASLAALTVDVNAYADGAVSAEATRVDGLLTDLEDPTTGLIATSSVISQLTSDVSTLDGTTTSQASDITQLLARVSGSYASVVNPLTDTGENFGSNYVSADIQAYADLGGRSGVAARRDASSNDQKIVYKFDGTRLKVQPRGVYEVKFSLYHARGEANDNGTFLIGPAAFASATAGVGSAASTTRVNNGVAADSTATPYWLSGYKTVGGNTWLDVTCYILGADVNVSTCPDLRVNGATTNAAGYTDFYDGVQVSAANPYVELHVNNFNASPTYGDDTTTTLYLTDLQVRRVDSEASNYAALETQSSVIASDVGDLSALYGIKVELNAAGDPYVAGFGLQADLVDGVPSSAFGVQADVFFIQHPSVAGTTNIPFAVGQVNGVNTVGINGELVVDGTINTQSLVAGAVTANEISVASLEAVSANMGTLTSGTIRTVEVVGPDTYYVELEDTAGGNEWPIWYGKGPKSAGNGLFYVTDDGDVIVKGLLDAGMIKQSYFTPAGANNSFRIACDYPSNYSGGVYTGKKAHINPVLTTGYVAPQGSYGTVIIASSPTNNAQSKAQLNTGYNTAALRWYSPTNSSTYEYGRLGSLSETLVVRYAANVSNEFSDQQFWAILQYRYDAGTWRNAYVLHTKAPRGARFASMSAEDVFITRDTAWDTLDIRLGLGCEWLDSVLRGTAQTVNLTVETANFGYADLASQETIDSVTGSTQGSTTIVRDPTKFRQYL